MSHENYKARADKARDDLSRHEAAVAVDDYDRDFPQIPSRLRVLTAGIAIGYLCCALTVLVGWLLFSR